VLGRDSTFTGRTDIWAELVPVVKQGPILGCGFGGYWTPETRAIHIVGQAHNGYLEVLMELGFVGLVLVSMFMLSCARKAAMVLAQDFDWASFCIGCVLMVLLHNSTEASINSFTNYLTAIILFVGICIPTGAVHPNHEKNRHETEDMPQIVTCPIPTDPLPKSQLLSCSSDAPGACAATQEKPSSACNRIMLECRHELALCRI
jgi:hypothetical protein